MQQKFIDYLACPNCHSTLILGEEANDANKEIMDGVLECEGCRDTYPIRGGIPRFPIDHEEHRKETTLQTQQIYNFTWRHFGLQEITQGWQKDSYSYLEQIPESLLGGPGTTGLEAGCGSGADLVRIAQNGSFIVGVDVSAGVDMAYLATQHLPNVLIVQADIHRLPFRANTFDFIYSFGVLHHLFEPEEGFKQLQPLLKENCPLITYLYENFDNHSVLEQSLLTIATRLRQVTTLVPPRLLDFFCCLLVPVVWLLCSLPARVARDFFPKLFKKIPFRHTLNWATLRSDLFDRLAPPIETRFSASQVRELYQKTGLERVEVCHYRGWVSWGFTTRGKEGHRRVCR